MPTATDPKKDFNAGALLQEHGKGISSLEDRVDALEKKLSNPELLAKTLEDASSDSKRLDKLFSKLFCDMLKNDDDVKSSFAEKLNSVDRDAVSSNLKKFGGLVGFGLWTVAIIIVTAWAEHHFGK